MLLKLALVGVAVFVTTAAYVLNVYRTTAWRDFNSLDSKIFTVSIVLSGAGLGLAIGAGIAAAILALV